MNTAKKSQTFEQAMNRLEEIVSLLENGGASLDDTMKLYNEGCKLSAFCSNKLDKANELVAKAVENSKTEEINVKDKI